MKRQTPLSEVVFRKLFPKCQDSSNDPTSWNSHVRNHLIKEVRIATQDFYGEINSLAARYPGLDYSDALHRRRLNRYPHHARLFRALDALGLTPSEVNEICTWEGTLAARRKYERDRCLVIEDTLDGIPHWDDPAEVERRSKKQLQIEAEVAFRTACLALQDDSTSKTDDSQEEQPRHDEEAHVSDVGAESEDAHHIDAQGNTRVRLRNPQIMSRWNEHAAPTESTTESNPTQPQLTINRPSAQASTPPASPRPLSFRGNVVISPSGRPVPPPRSSTHTRTSIRSTSTSSRPARSTSETADLDLFDNLQGILSSFLNALRRSSANANSTELAYLEGLLKEVEEATRLPDLERIHRLLGSQQS